MNINPWATVQRMIDDALAVRCPYSIDDVYVTFSSTEPTARWPGTSWERITDCFLRAADSTHPAGSTGGAWEVVQTVEQMPKHTHAYASYQSGYPVQHAGDDIYITPVGHKPYSDVEYSQTRSTSTGAGKPMPIVNKYTAVYMWRRTT